MNRVRCGLVVATTAAALVATPLLPTVAHADARWISFNSGSGWAHDASAPLFDVTGIYPGWSESRSLQVRNDAVGTGVLALSAFDVVDDENGCNHPESYADATCGRDEGELGHQIELAAYVDPEDDGTFEPTPTWSGTVYDLANPTVLTTNVPGGDAVGIRLDAALPSTSGNETQTDQLGFGLRFDLEARGAVVSTKVEGTKIQRDDGRTGVDGTLGDLGDRLPYTGTVTEKLAYLGLWLVLLGAFVVVGVHALRRRR